MGIFNRFFKKNNEFEYDGGIPIPDDVDEVQKFMFERIMFSITKFGINHLDNLVFCMDNKVLFVVDNVNKIPKSCEYYFPLNNHSKLNEIKQITKKSNDIDEICEIVYHTLPETVMGLKLQKF